jgi:NDP-sugar pyrophosphorylase family protein
MKGMILAAGKGERLRPLTDTVPKPMIPVAGRPLIEYTLAFLRRNGIMEVIVNLHHLGRVVEEYLIDGSRWGMKIVYSREEQLLGTGGGIKRAELLLGGETFVVVNADILVDLDLDEVVRFHKTRKATATMVLRDDHDVDRYGAIEIDDHGRVQQFLGKFPWSGPRLRRLMFTGIHIMEPAVFSYMREERGPFSITEKTYPKMLRAGERIFGYEMEGFWIDLGTMSHYKALIERIDRGELNFSKHLFME